MPVRDLVRDCVPVSLPVGGLEREAVATCDTEKLTVAEVLGVADAESDLLPLPVPEGDRVAEAVGDALVDLLGEREGVAAPLAVLEEDCVRVSVGEALWGCDGERVSVADPVEEVDALRVNVADGVSVRVDDPVADSVPAADAV